MGAICLTQAELPPAPASNRLLRTTRSSAAAISSAPAANLLADQRGCNGNGRSTRRQAAGQVTSPTRWARWTASVRLRTASLR